MDKKTIFSGVFVLSILLTACTQQPNSQNNIENKTATMRQQTTVQKDSSGRYANQQFKFALTLPSKWDVQELELQPSKTSIKYFPVLNIIDLSSESRKVGTLTVYIRQDNQTPAQIDKLIEKELINMYHEPIYLDSDKKITLPNKLTGTYRENAFCKPILCDKYTIVMKNYILEFNQIKGDPDTQPSQSNTENTKSFKQLIDSLQQI